MSEPSNHDRAQLAALAAHTAHSTTISAAALAARVAALEAQLALAQRDNTRLIERIVELEHERDAARRWAGAWRRQAWCERHSRHFWRRQTIERGERYDASLAGLCARIEALKGVCQRLADGAAQRSQSHVDVLAALSEVGVRPAVPAEPPPGGRCVNCDGPLVSAVTRDAVPVLWRGERREAHAACARLLEGKHG